MLNRTRLVCGVVAMSSFAVAGADALAGDNLVFNGGFEQGFAGWGVPPNAPPGPNGANFQTPTDNPHSGLRYAQLSSTQFLYVWQVLPGTVAGTEYELEFWVRLPQTIPPGFGPSLAVRWEGQHVLWQQIDGPLSGSWQQFVVPLTASFSGSLLEFGQNAFPGEVHIDTISVIAVPGPCTAGLLAFAAAASAARRSRR